MIEYEDERIKVTKTSTGNLIEVKPGTSIFEAMGLYPQYFSMQPKRLNSMASEEDAIVRT